MFWFKLTHIIKLIRDHMGIYTVAKFGTDRSIFADARVLTKSNMANFLIQGQINSESSGLISSIIKLIRDLMVIYILTKFGADWLIFADARVLTRKLWTDGHWTLSDHNSSLSTLCSGELKNMQFELSPLIVWTAL